MTKHWQVLVWAWVIPLFAGCFMSNTPPEEPPVTEPPPVPEPPPEPPITEPPTPGLEVDAVISAAYLGDACGEAAGTDGDCDIDGCGCSPSTMQLRFSTVEDYGELPIRVVRVAMHAYESGEYLQDLEASLPVVWDEMAGYVAWDEVLATPAEENVSYSLEAPGWEGIYARFESPWSMSYQLRVTVEIGDEERTLLSGEVYRISAIDT